MKQRVLFVCLGNICRSPMAEEIFRQMVIKRGLTDKFEIDSAGTYSGHAGELADPRMREAAHCRGYCLTHRSRPFRESDFEDFDRIVVMDDSNYERVCRLAPTRVHIDKVYRMRDYFTTFRTDYDYVPDPYYEGREGFYLVINMLEEACEKLLDEMVSATNI
ncbi:MAG: low molecular weight phosphotyrosine protein phosphatase [Alistipes sp.]|nr:low molecular weight phosphotyrosine protein phosphatase [Alistipes sp.]